MRNTAFLLLGIGLIVLQSNLFRLFGLVHIAGSTPSLTLPLIVFWGVHEYSLARGAALAFALGYLVDVFAAAPMGLYTFTSVAIFVVARVAGVRLAAQTMLTKAGLAFAFSLLEGALVIILIAIFGKDPFRPRALAALLLPHAGATSLCAPLVFYVAQRIHEATVSVPHPEKVTEK